MPLSWVPLALRRLQSSCWAGAEGAVRGEAICFQADLCGGGRPCSLLPHGPLCLAAS